MRRTLDHSRQRGCFREREIAKFFSEEDSGRFFNAADCDSTTLAQVDLVTVKRKDVVLREPAFQRYGQHRLCVLSFQRFFGREISVLDELLSDSRAPVDQP